MRSRAFTLVELIISLALILVLMTGVTYVFRTTADAVGTGSALSGLTRAQRAVHTVVPVDIQGFSDQSPALVIDSRVNDLLGTPVFLDKSSADANVAGQFRTDIVGFLARGAFRRQTANWGSLTSDQSSGTAWIWYGHVNTPDNTGAGSHAPGTNSAAPNYLARQWTLGRMAILLRQKTYPSVGPTDIPYGSALQSFIEDSVGVSMSPLGINSPARIVATSPADPGAYVIQDSRFDLAGTAGEPITDLTAKITATADWWTYLAYRFHCDPFPVRPLDSVKAARTIPHLLANCSDFRVEFAGDYNADGVIDFFTEDGVDKTQWYGLARDSDGNGSIDVGTVAVKTGTARPFERTTTATQYLCAWGPDVLTEIRPHLLRFSFRMFDTHSRLVDGQWFEYIVEVPR